LPAVQVLTGNDVPSDLPARILRVEGDMVGGGPMASLAIDVYDERFLIECVYIILIGWRDIGRMALKTVKEHRSVKEWYARRVAGAAGPSVQIGKIRDRQLVELVFFPVEIALALRIAEHDIETLRPRLFVVYVQYLERRSCAILHDYADRVIHDESVGVFGKTALDTVEGRQSSRMEVRRMAIAVDDRSMTGSAGCRIGIGLAPRILRTGIHTAGEEKDAG
jgi:hypothetical protein